MAKNMGRFLSLMWEDMETRFLIALTSSTLLVWLKDVLPDIEALVCNDLSSF